MGGGGNSLEQFRGPAISVDKSGSDGTKNKTVIRWHLQLYRHKPRPLCCLSLHAVMSALNVCVNVCRFSKCNLKPELDCSKEQDAISAFSMIHIRLMEARRRMHKSCVCLKSSQERKVKWSRQWDRLQHSANIKKTHSDILENVKMVICGLRRAVEQCFNTENVLITSWSLFFILKQKKHHQTQQFDSFLIKDGGGDQGQI